jgi:hypothetical protein
VAVAVELPPDDVPARFRVIVKYAGGGTVADVSVHAADAYDRGLGLLGLVIPSGLLTPGEHRLEVRDGERLLADRPFLVVGSRAR